MPASDLRRQVGGGQRGEIGVSGAVVAHLEEAICDALGDLVRELREEIDRVADQEEGGRHAVFTEDLEGSQAGPGDGVVVEGEGDPLALGRAAEHDRGRRRRLGDRGQEKDEKDGYERREQEHQRPAQRGQRGSRDESRHPWRRNGQRRSPEDASTLLVEPMLGQFRAPEQVFLRRPA